MKYVGITALILVSLIAIIGLSVGGEYLNLWWRQTFEPAHENIDREVWENTNSRINSAAQEINKRMLEFNRLADISRVGRLPLPDFPVSWIKPETRSPKPAPYPPRETNAC